MTSTLLRFSMDNKHHAPIGIIIILFIIIIGTAFLIKEDKRVVLENDNANQQQAQTASLPAYKCGMTVTAPLPGSTVSFPLTVAGKFDNLAATDGCTWNMFEGMAGTVTIADPTGPHATVGLAVNGDWTGNVPVTFSGILNPPVVFSSGTPLKLTFTEEDPSGENLGSTFSYNVIAQ